MQLSCWDTAVELLQVTFHDAPHVFNLVGGTKVSIAVVAAFVGVAVKLQVMVTGMGVGEQEAASGNTVRQKHLQGILSSVRDNLEAEPPGIPFNGANDHGLVAILLFAEETFVYFDNAGKLWHCAGQIGSESPVPPTYSRVTDAGC